MIPLTKKQKKIMESLAKLVIIIMLVIMLVIEIGIIIIICKLFPNLGYWWILVSPISLLLSFLISLIILKLLTKIK